MQNVLVLNSDWTPINICNFKRAMRLVLSQKVDIIENYDELLHTGRRPFQAPSVIRLKYYVKKPHFDIALSKANIHRRDDYTCQYCGCKVDKPTVDHVIPRKLGGKSTWENLVTCCYACNNKKGHKSVAEVGFTLLRKPIKPTYSALFRMKGKYKHNSSWAQYLPN